METTREPVASSELTSVEKRKLRKKNYKQKKRKENRQSGSFSSSCTDPNLFSQENEQNDKQILEENTNRGVLRGTFSVLRKLKSEPLISEISFEDDKSLSKTTTIGGRYDLNNVNNNTANNKVDELSGEEKSASEATDQSKNPKKRVFGPWLSDEDGPSRKKVNISLTPQTDEISAAICFTN